MPELLQEERFAFMDTETKKPLIQIDDEIREMTDEEFAAHQEMQKNSIKLGASDDSE